jgi:predicted DNA binding CopG/RHH family protein
MAGIAKYIARLCDHDFKWIQKKALQMGIPYQTLISAVIHRYIEGDLISKDGFPV